jgi:hypothetical protein
MQSTSNNRFTLSNSTEKIIQKLCIVLNNLVSVNQNKMMCSVNQSSLCEEKTKSFDLNSLPNITLKEYLVRLVFYSKVGDSTLICSLILLDKFLNKTKTSISNKNIFLLVLTSLQVAMKINEDVILRDADYAFLGMVNSKILNYNESLFLHSLDYEVNVSPSYYENYKSLFV